tara:strand:+ start:1852 stop:2109 length:258 start_codon:yes stop_codon:yes gene_type:complete
MKEQAIAWMHGPITKVNPLDKNPELCREIIAMIHSLEEEEQKCFFSDVLDLEMEEYHKGTHWHSYVQTHLHEYLNTIDGYRPGGN